MVKGVGHVFGFPQIWVLEPGKSTTAWKNNFSFTTYMEMARLPLLHETVVREKHEPAKAPCMALVSAGIVTCV